jgi:hypothetical protein
MSDSFLSGTKIIEAIAQKGRSQIARGTEGENAGNHSNHDQRRRVARQRGLVHKQRGGSRGSADTTVRTHLGNLFEKTGCGRQADLVKIVAGFSTPLLG